MKTKHLVISIALAVSACSDSGPRAQYKTEDCDKLRLLDADTGEVIRGAEDLTLSASQDAIIVSAYDRWAAEAAARSGAAAIPKGNLYWISSPRELGEVTERTVAALTSSVRDALDFRPHGLDLLESPEGTTLAVINRRYVKDDGAAWRMETTLEIFDVDDDRLSHRHTVKSDLLCRANGIAAISANAFLVTRDHGACEGLAMTIEDIFGLARGKLLYVSLDSESNKEAAVNVVADRLAFANGIAVDFETGLAYVAATRSDSIHVYSLDNLTSGIAENSETRIPVRSAPDNLTLESTENLLFAGHPSLLSLGFYRNRWLGTSKAPSQIYALNTNTQDTSLLFDDPEGNIFSAATTAVTIDDTLVAGSVADDGLLVCRHTTNDSADF